MITSKISNNSKRIAELVSLITGKRLVGDNGETTIMAGTTYRFDLRPAPYATQAAYAQQSEVITLEDAILSIQNRLQENVAMNTATVQAIYDLWVLSRTEGFPFYIPLHTLANRELKVRLLALKSNWSDINGDIIYNVLFYLLTGRTQYVRTFREYTNATSDARPDLIESFIQTKRDELAKYYRRNRNLLLFIKKTASKGTRPIINRISKYSHVENVPLPEKKDTPLETKPTSELKKMLSASNVITVRNGRQYKLDHQTATARNKERVLKVLRTRDDIYSDEHQQLARKGWRVAVASSAKRGLGNIPNGSFLPVHPGDTIGVRWFDTGEHNDFDLSLLDGNGNNKYGWNGYHDGRYSYSGDMTHTVYNEKTKRYEASEYFTFNDVTSFVQLDLSSYSEAGTAKIELFIGDEIIPFEIPANTSILGFLRDGKFYIEYQEKGRGDFNVSDSNDIVVGQTKYYYL